MLTGTTMLDGVRDRTLYWERMNTREFTAVYKQRGAQYIAWIDEIPGVNTQGKTKAETKENLKEALSLILEVNRELAASRAGQTAVIREPLRVGIPAHA